MYYPLKKNGNEENKNIIIFFFCFGFAEPQLILLEEGRCSANVEFLIFNVSPWNSFPFFTSYSPDI